MTHRAVRGLVAAVAMLAVLATVLGFRPPVSEAAAPAYVALGDSYSSGVGTRSYRDDGTSCRRSSYGYPALIAAAKGFSLRLRACSGARIADVRTDQLSALTTSTSYVTISVGGNDAGFSHVLSTCARPSWMSDCDKAVDAAQHYITEDLSDALASLYVDIEERAPNARVVVVGYPRIFNGEDCNAGTWFSPREERRLNATAELLDSTTGSAASAAGFAFADPTRRFTGHAVCADVEWINGLSRPVSESYHPNRSGYSSGYAPLVSPLLTG